jgi:hypothetical protein
MARRRRTDHRGRWQRTRTRTGRARQPDLMKFYDVRLHPTPLTPPRWKIQLLRAGKPTLDIEGLVEAFNWSDDATEMTGNLQCHRPVRGKRHSLPIEHAQRVRLRVKWGWDHVWHELWTMRTKAPEYDRTTNTLSVDLADDLDLLKGSKREWSFRTSKHRSHGYTADEITLLVAKRIGIKVGQLAKGHHKIDKLVKKSAYPLDVIKAAYQAERKATGRKFVVRIRRQKLEVVPYGRNKQAYVLREQVQQLTTQPKPKRDRPFTVLTGKASVGKGKDKGKVRHTETASGRLIRRYGYIHQDKDYGTVKSSDELRHKVRHDLAEAVRVELTATLTHTGLPYLRRGDGLRLHIDNEGFRGHRSFVYAETVAHNVTGGSYTTELNVTTKDPYKADLERQRKEKKQREKKRRERHHRKGT